MNAIQLKNVSFTYEGSETPILKNVDFDAEYGKVTLLSGLSGEGKSTLLSLISGIIPNVIDGKTEGEVFVGGENIAGRRMGYVCRKVGMVLQNADAQIIQSIVEDEIAFGCENFAFPPEKIKAQITRSCALMKLDPMWRTRTLSGGQKQRLITASTIATGQKILVLDEPLANLDIAGAELLMNTLKVLAKENYAVLVAEHRIDMVLPFVDRVWDMRGGKLNEISDKREYLSSRSEVFTDSCSLSPSGENIFSLDRVAYKVKDREILKDVSFDVKRGERLLLLGENGCGKTTLLRLIARLQRPTGGEIRQGLDGKFGKKKRGKKWFKKVGVVYQNPNYQLFMPTVRKEIAFGAKSQEFADEIIKLFGLESLARRHPQSLSEGQKRRVSIAAVAAAEPEVILLDEPTVGQDYTGLKDLVRILNDLHERSGNTMITITHDMRCAEALCDRAVVIADGTVAEEGGKDLVRKYFFENNPLLNKI